MVGTNEPFAYLELLYEQPKTNNNKMYEKIRIAYRVSEINRLSGREEKGRKEGDR